ncbi:MAG TPA: hypothetical protein VG713_11160 [Pirellulales bacterium]|nr:hypothetical protein [Pirellulales bacterium]
MSHVAEYSKRGALGALGGLAGTVAIQSLLKASQKWAPSAVPPMRDEPGHFMVHKAKQALPRSAQSSIPKPIEKGAEQLLGIGYGLTFGALCAAVRNRRRSVVVDGALLGTLTWAAGYLGWLPAAGLMPPLWRQRTTQVAAPIAEHVVYGVITVAVYDWLNDHL